MRFILDENVPRSVEEMLNERGHSVASIREYVLPGSPDQLVAAVTEQADAVLVSHDSDFRKIAPRIPDGQKSRFRRLSMVRMRCEKPRSAERLRAAISLIEFEFEERQRMPDKRMIVTVGKANVTISR
jgi:predicted nuclease of predicted toxin-antitoxin system